MRRLATVLLLLAGSAGAAPSTDVADDEPAELEPISVKAKLVGTAVQIVARFELNALGPSTPPGDVRTFALPARAVITGATALSGGQTHRLQLLKEADVSKKLAILDEMPTANGGRASAIHIDADDSTATLDVAVPRRTAIRLDVTLEVPTCYANNARHFIVPPAWVDRISGATRVEAAEIESVDDRCDEDSEGRTRFAIAARPKQIAYDSARVSLGATDVARVEIALARQLTEMPRDLHTVFVVDHSRSLTAEQHEIQRAVIAAYLRAAPRARIQLVGYTRDARPQLAGWMLASQAGARIERQLRSLSPRNGSNVDVGVATAATLLANVTGTRRIVVFSDALLSSKQSEEATQAAAAVGLPPGTLIHVVHLGGFEPGLVRDDSHVLAPLAKQTEGIVMNADVEEDGTLDALALVRPISLDNITIEAPGWSPLFDGPHCLHDPALREGAACNFTAFGPPTGGAFQIAGMLWNTKVTRTITPDPRGGRSLARMLSTASGLPSELVEPIQNAARAVNSAWSLVALWGPSGGYADQEKWGTFGFGRIGGSSVHTHSHDIGTGRTARHAPDDVRAQLTPAVLHCKPTGAVRVIVALTKEEIVEVEVFTRDKRDEPLAECIATNVWDTMLSLASPATHHSVVVDVQP